MLPGIYAASSTFRHNQRALSLLNHNLANSQTPGFRESLLLVRSKENEQASFEMDGRVRRGIASSYATQVAGIYKNHHAPTLLQNTGNPMNLAILPHIHNGFFRVAKQANGGEHYYTRNGQISLAPLYPEQADSPTVLHLAGAIALDAQGKPIEVDMSRGALEISDSGKLSQAGNPLTELPIYRLNRGPDIRQQEDAQLHRLEAMGDSLYRIPPSHVDQMHPMRIVDREKLVRQGALEGANVNVMRQVAELTELSRHTEALRKVAGGGLDGLQKLFSLIRQ